MYSNYECNLNPTSFWTKGFAPKLNEYTNSAALVGGGNCIVGSHSSTIDRLYAWEKKLFQEVKVNLLLFFIVKVFFNFFTKFQIVKSIIL